MSSAVRSEAVSPLTRISSGTAYLAILVATVDLSSFTTASASPTLSFNTMKANAAGRRATF